MPTRFHQTCPFPVHVDWLPYAGLLDKRDPDGIELVVVHCTELPDLAMAREYGERIHHRDSGTGNSGHFYIDRDGRVEQWVPLGRVAHHVADHNRNTVGIELVNRGRYPHWWHAGNQAMTEPYPVDQIAALVALVDALADHLPSLAGITGHEQLDTRMVEAEDDPGQRVPRKMDPGPCFPWAQVLDQCRLKFLPGPAP